MARLSDEALEKNTELVNKLVESFPSGNGLAGLGRREHVQAMLRGPVGLEYFTCPASAKEEYHNAFPGGLCDHSLRVTRNLRALVKALDVKDFDVPTLNFVGLFHDFGKVGDGVEPYYLANADDWQRKRGILYNINPKCVFMPTSERGLYILQKFKIELTPDEYLAIRLNDGMYDETNKRYAMREPDLALLVHMADRWACSQEKKLV